LDLLGGHAVCQESDRAADPHPQPTRSVADLPVIYELSGTCVCVSLAITIQSRSLSDFSTSLDQLGRLRREGVTTARRRQAAGLTVSRAGDAKQGQQPSRVAGVAAQGGDVAVAAQAQDANGEVAQAGHGPWDVAGADLGDILGEGGVADVVQRLDAQ
jgi:hypothetical protein